MHKTIFEKRGQHGESNVYLDEFSNGNTLFTKEFDKEFISESNEELKLLWGDYLKLYHLLHHIISSNTVHGKFKRSHYIGIHHSKRKDYNVEKRRLEFTNYKVNFIDLDPRNIFEGTSINNKKEKYITHPIYTTGNTLCELLSGHQIIGSSSRGYPEYEHNEFIYEIGNNIAKQLNSKFGKYGIIFKQDDFQALNLKIDNLKSSKKGYFDSMSETHTIEMTCTDIGSSIGRIVLRNRQALHHIYNKPTDKKYKDLQINSSYCSNATLTDILKVSSQIKHLGG